MTLSFKDFCDKLIMLAEEIHNQYNLKQAERKPNDPLKYADFASLDDSLKYSNLRQAMDIFEKIELMGYEVSELSEISDPIRTFPAELVERMAEREHELWMKEKKELGIVSPYIMSYSELSDEVKQLDRDAIENIPLLLERIGLGLCMRS